MHAAIHGDLSSRTVVDTKAISWTPSPGGAVLRKRVHLVGPPEAGQVTAVVQYEPDSHFHSHDHPDGEEILVIDGVFSDEHGHWPTGTYLLNPEGFRHAPYSRNGCLLFVKLRQFPGRDRQHIIVDTVNSPWQRTGDRELKQLYSQPGYEDSMRLERWPPASTIDEREFPLGAELFVLRGTFEDKHGFYDAHTWLRLPPHSTQTLKTEDGCELYVKEGGFAYLRSA
ncbi:MAG TPA: cupin domain-containing protein [Terracidiphilus sp.]|nr:cupin domain-containing protein [Terracidiphilus sp.]